MKAAAYATVTLVTLLAWWLLTATGVTNPLILPPLGDVVAALRQQDPATWAAAMAVTTVRATAGFAAATVLAVPVGVLVGRNATLSHAYEPLLATLTAVPLVVLYPVLAATLGLGTSSKVALGGLYAFFPIAIATIRAVGQTDPVLVTAMRSMGATHGRVIRAVVVPSALPGIVAGLRIGFGLALVTVIAGEFIAGDDGVGYQLAASSQGYQSADLFAWVVLAVVLTIAVNTVFTFLATTLERTLRR
ncbi:ABC-type nitrate/sulfonate/bicarbonate transport system permease component [Actinoplanes tereljensis]|uniref:Taurine ABC transporter permease n=1 Tax=Paractinoplanes tereljensis TaxID=571912 RepID=A0A919TXS9_9ACTN|nr:ABC transporter permease subunit [Actinoplanes tereljensis]GIF26661.1 taurine ABC transporter permease [Actinoplanes tereljensis]